MNNVTNSVRSTMEEFITELKENNSLSKANIRNIFKEHLTELDSNNCCIFLTGSDGRHEKLSKDSPYELIVVFKRDISEEEKKKIKDSIEEILNQNVSKFDQEVEYKGLEKNSSVLNYNNSIIPTRALD